MGKNPDEDPSGTEQILDETLDFKTKFIKDRIAETRFADRQYIVDLM